MKRIVQVLVVLAMVFMALPLQAQQNGTLKGVVVLKGEVPKNPTIEIPTDRDYCGSKKTIPEFIVGANGQLKNAVVWLEGVKSPAVLPKKDVYITIKDCFPTKRVSIGFVGSNFIFKNEDPILHTVQLKLWLEYQRHVSRRPLKEGATIYNVALPKMAMVVKRPIKRYHRYTKDTGMIRITSNTHPWMSGYIFVFDHPYAQVTDKSGKFKIEGIPAGHYKLMIWHEGIGIVEKEVDIKPGKVTNITIQLSRQPEAKFRETSYDFGTIKVGQKVSHKFMVENKGNAVLKIVELIPA